MFSSKHLVFGFFVLFLLTGCAQEPLNSIDRNRYKTVALSPDMKVPPHYHYSDTTGQTTRAVGAGVIGMIIAGISEGSGQNRFDAVVSKCPVDIKTTLERHLESALKKSPFKMVKDNADTTLSVEVHAYGVGPVKAHEMGGAISATAKLLGRDGKTIWQKFESAASTTTAPLKTIEENPKLWPRMIDEAAEGLAQKLVLETQKKVATPPDPLR